MIISSGAIWKAIVEKNIRYQLFFAKRHQIQESPLSCSVDLSLLTY
jgi:hypothetical protein